MIWHWADKLSNLGVHVAEIFLKMAVDRTNGDQPQETWASLT